MRRKKYFLFGVFFIMAAHAALAENLLYAKEKTTSIDLELSQVSVIATAFDEKCIAYRYELAEGKKLSCIETQHTLRIRQMTPSHGTLYLFIPKEMLLETCSMRINRASLTCENIKAVHFQIMLNIGACAVKACTCKNAIINLARGTLSLVNTQIVKSCACTLTDTVADIIFPSGQEEYHIDYVQNRTELNIGGTTVKKTTGEYGNQKAKRRIIFSGGAVKASIRFQGLSQP